jgi:hypothetical protein
MFVHHIDCILLKVHVNQDKNDALLRHEGTRQDGEGVALFREVELRAQTIKHRSSRIEAISSISHSTIAECSSALCMSGFIDFWRETDSRGLLPWNIPDCVFVPGGVSALPSRVPIGITGGVQPNLKCTLATYLQAKSPPSQGCALLLLHRVMLMLKALHASSLVAVGLCSSAIICVRPQHPDEYYEGAMGSDLFADLGEKQRSGGIYLVVLKWRVVCGL